MKKVGLYVIPLLLLTACAQMTGNVKRPLIIFERKGGYMDFNQRLVLFPGGEAVYEDLNTGGKYWFRVTKEELDEVLDLVNTLDVFKSEPPDYVIDQKDVYFVLTVKSKKDARYAFFRLRTLKGKQKLLVERLNKILDKKAWPKFSP